MLRVRGFVVRGLVGWASSEEMLFLTRCLPSAIKPREFYSGNTECKI